MKKLLLSAITLMLSVNTNVFAANLDRLGGENRYETAALINNKMMSETLIIASGNDFADALSSTSLVKYYNAEIHLVNKELDTNTINSLNNNEFKKVIIVGGTKVISTDIENELKLKLGSENVKRIGGKDRYETSELIAANVLEVNNSVNVAFIATGNDFADALSVGPIAAYFGYPIILTPGDYIGKLGLSILETVGGYYKIGGEAAISDNIDNLISNKSFQIKRLAGNNRYETNKAVIDEFYLSAFDHKTLYVASGLNFPDALAGSALAAKNKAPIVFISNRAEATTQEVVNSFQNNSLIALGGPAVVSDETMQTLIENSENREIVFKYKNKIVLSVEEGNIPTAEDICLVALDKEGKDCSETFSLRRVCIPEASDDDIGFMEFSVTMDGNDYFGSVTYTRE